MADTFTRNGKQILRNGEHFADGVSETGAEALLATLNRGRAWEDQEIVDLMSDAMSDVHDMDTGLADFARAALAALKKEGIL